MTVWKVENWQEDDKVDGWIALPSNQLCNGNETLAKTLRSSFHCPHTDIDGGRQTDAAHSVRASETKG